MIDPESVRTLADVLKAHRGMAYPVPLDPTIQTLHECADEIERLKTLIRDLELEIKRPLDVIDSWRL